MTVMEEISEALVFKSNIDMAVFCTRLSHATGRFMSLAHPTPYT
jgi:hypothetical protein